MGEPTRDVATGAPWSVRLHSILDAAAWRRPDAPAVRDERGGWSYAELADHSERLARWLAGQGVRRGDRVLLRMGNRREQVAILFGASRIGAIAVPVHPDLKPFLLADLVADADPALVVLEEADADGWASLGGRTAVAVTELWAQLDNGGDGPAYPYPYPSDTDAVPTDLCLMIYTSGSTSRPKAVTSSHAQVHFATLAIAERLGYRADDIVFVRLPLSFDYGLYQVFLAALSTAAIVFSDSGPDLTLDRQIRSAGATVVPLVPSIAATLTALAERVRPDTPGGPPPSRVRLFTNACGAALNPPAVSRLRRAYPEAAVCLMFGITECKRVTILEPDGDLTRPNSVGRPLPGTEVQILTEAGTPAPTGEVGEIVVRGPHVMTGYWRAPELTAARFPADRPDRRAPAAHRRLRLPRRGRTPLLRRPAGRHREAPGSAGESHRGRVGGGARILRRQPVRGGPPRRQRPAGDLREWHRDGQRRPASAGRAPRSGPTARLVPPAGPDAGHRQR